MCSGRLEDLRCAGWMHAICSIEVSDINAPNIQYCDYLL